MNKVMNSQPAHLYWLKYSRRLFSVASNHFNASVAHRRSTTICWSCTSTRCRIISGISKQGRTHTHTHTHTLQAWYLQGIFPSLIFPSHAFLATSQSWNFLHFPVSVNLCKNFILCVFSLYFFYSYWISLVLSFNLSIVLTVAYGL